MINRGNNYREKKIFVKIHHKSDIELTIQCGLAL